MLKPGDPCPCCGQPIKTKDTAILALLTYILERGVNQKAFRDFVGVKRGVVNTLQIVAEDE